MAGSECSLLHTQGVLSQNGVPCMNYLYALTTFPLTYIYIYVCVQYIRMISECISRLQVLNIREQLLPKKLCGLCTAPHLAPVCHSYVACAGHVRMCRGSKGWSIRVCQDLQVRKTSVQKDCLATPCIVFPPEFAFWKSMEILQYVTIGRTTYTNILEVLEVNSSTDWMFQGNAIVGSCGWQRCDGPGCPGWDHAWNPLKPHAFHGGSPPLTFQPLCPGKIW